MTRKYKATIELSFDAPDEKAEKIVLEHLEYNIDEQARRLAEYQDAKIYISNFYEVKHD